MSSPAMAFRDLAPADGAWREAARGWSPPPKISLSDWLDEHYHPSEIAGRWKTLPFQRGIAEAFIDPELEQVTVLKSARVGFTKLLVGYNCYRIALDPCGILIVQPAQEDAEGFSKEDLAPAIEATPAVAALVSDPRGRDGSNTILSKQFAGGSIKIVGAHSGRGFRRISVDVVEFDEADAYPRSAGSEGDQIALGKKRAHTAAFPKFILGSTPLLLETSRIVLSWKDSDQRDYLVPCPHCDHGQRLEWGGREKDFGLKWPPGRPAEAYYLCIQCHAEIAHSEKLGMVERGDWIAARPEVQGHAGFRIWAAYSPFPQASWGAIATEWLAAHPYPSKRQVFINTVRGEPYAETYDALQDDVLAARREYYPVAPTGARTATGEPETEIVVPRGVVLLTAGVDVHDDRFEAQLVGWGDGEEAWGFEYHVLPGDPASPELWAELDEWILRPRRLERGGTDFVRATAVDTGGHHTQAAYAFCRPRFRRRMPDRRLAYVFSIKGVGGRGKIWPQEASKNRAVRQKAILWNVHVDPAKDALFSNLRKTAKADVGASGPGLFHFPLARPGFGEAFFQGLNAEKRVPGTDRDGFPTSAWQLAAGMRNEQWDTLVYAYIALRGLVDGMGHDFAREVLRVRKLVQEALGDAPPVVARTARPASAPAETPRPPPRGRRPRRRWRPAQL